MKKLKRELNVLSTNCKNFISKCIVAEDFETLIKMSSTTKKAS